MRYTFIITIISYALLFYSCSAPNGIVKDEEAIQANDEPFETINLTYQKIA